MTDPNDADPARAAVRVAESVVTLVRAEAALALAQTRAAGERLLLTLVLVSSAVFSLALAIVVIVFSPMLWALRPSAALATLAIAVGVAGVTSLVALKRCQRHRKAEAHEEPRPDVALEPRRRDQHAVPR